MSNLSILFRAAQLPMTIQLLKIFPIKLVQIVKINGKNAFHGPVYAAQLRASK